MKLRIDEECKDRIVVDVHIDDEAEFRSFMDDTGVFFKDKGDCGDFIQYVVDPDGMPFLKEWNKTHE